ncbi:cytochrome P450, partial [Rhodococcus sp. NPDC127593]
MHSMVEAVSAKITPVVPMHRQIKGLGAVDRVIRRVTRDSGALNLAEAPVPPVEDVALADIDLSNPFLYRQGAWDSYSARLRNEAPVHFQADSPFGPFWSVTKYADIIAVDKDHERFSAEPFNLLGDLARFLDLELFLALDPPKHDLQRKAVQGVVAPKNLLEMEGLIRSRVQEVLDSLPLGEPFDFVSTVAIELTARMLATLLDYPYDERDKLIEWSELMAGVEGWVGGERQFDEVFAGVA